jgi:hypothetical protein
MMKKVALFMLAAVLVVGVAYAQETQTADEKASGNEQVKIKGPFKETWVHPDLDMAQYTKLYPWKTVFQFREGGEKKGAKTTAGQLRDSEGPYFVNDESRQKFEELVGDIFVKELNRSKIFEVVEEVGPDTLLVRAAVLDIVSNVPPNFTGTADVYLSAVGEASFIFELIDAETGVVQATVGERRRIQPPSRMYDVSSAPANSATIMNDIERWAQSVARDLRVALEKARKKATK